MGKNKLILLLIIPVMLLWIQPLFSQADPAEVLKFTDILGDSKISADYRLAVEEYEKSILEMELYRHPGDFGFNATPGVKFQWTDPETPLQTDININAGISWFLGRNEVSEEKYQAAVRSVETARLGMESALNDTVVIFYKLYSGLWLLQQEYLILDNEQSLARERYSGAYRMYLEGSISTSELEDAEEELRLAEESLQENSLDQRLTWFSLQQYRGKVVNDQNMTIPVLDEFWFNTPDVDKPSLLSEIASAVNYDVMKLQNALVSMEETAARLKKVNTGLSFKPYFGYDDYLATLTYAMDNNTMALNTAVPILSLNSTGSQDSQKKWNAGISLIFDIDSGKSDNLELKVLDKEILQQEILLKKQIDKSDLELRTLYQQQLQARQALQLAETAYQRQVRLRDAVSVRVDSGTALRIDLLSAETSLQRSFWKVSSARVAVQQAYLNYKLLEGNLNGIWQ